MPLPNKLNLKQKGIWAAKNGVQKISEMDFEYLKNCIKYLEKKCALEENDYLTKVGHKIKIDPNKRFPVYGELKDELKKRETNNSKSVSEGFIYTIDDLLGVEVKPRTKYKLKPKESDGNWIETQ